MGRKNDTPTDLNDASPYYEAGYKAGVTEGRIQGQIEGEDRALDSSARDARFTAAHLVFSTNTGYSDQHLKQIDALAQYLLTGHDPANMVVTEEALVSEQKRYSTKDLQAQYDDGWNSALEHANEQFHSKIGVLARIYQDEGADAALAAIRNASIEARR